MNRAPAAVFEDEPKCAVKQNRVKFSVNDLKALMTQLYDVASIDTLYGGLRCYSAYPQRDETGGYEDWRCRDISPALIHLAFTNVMGKYNSTVIIDRDPTAAVWNQPVRYYRIQSTRAISYRDFYQMAPFGNSSRLQAHSYQYVEMKYGYIREAFDYSGPLTYSNAADYFTIPMTLKYVLRLDENRTIIGGEWVKESKFDHVDFLWY
jgi:hypothetical protein